METKSIAFLSNTITKPFDRFLREFDVVHYPLGSVIAQLHGTIDEDIVVILLEASFFENDFTILRDAIYTFRQNNSTKIIINTITQNAPQIYVPTDTQQELKLAQLNNQIALLCEEFSNIAILDLHRLVKAYGYNTLINEKNGYLFQTPFTKIATELLASQIKEIIHLYETPRIKAICVDADNTLWGGIVGEDGVEGIAIDNNYPGIVYKKFQEYLLKLQKSGIILILLSKNDEKLVQEVFETRTMPLSLDDFTQTAINWLPKSENLATILQQLKLSTSGIIFLDDSAVEIAQMQERLGIDSYQMHPDDPLKNLQTLQNIPTLKALHLSQEDTQKALLYKQESSRLELSEMLHSKNAFIASLQTVIDVSCNQKKHLNRIAQLINKTNQFNLTTKRYSLEVIEALMQTSYVYDFQVRDKFGDMGIVGVIIIVDTLIDSFLISCRVLGRGIEERILAFITQKHKNLQAQFIPTEKNSLVENFYEKNGFELYKSNGRKYYKFSKNADFNEDIKVNYDN